MSRGTRILLLGKPPRRGHCKSRLAAGVGDGRAARLARAFLFDTWATVSSFVSARSDLDLVFAQSGEPEEYPLLLPTPTVQRQVDSDLGRRMASLTGGAFGQRDEVLLLGTDSPTLTEQQLSTSLSRLADADIVLGPTPDGGFWCLGVRAGHQALRGNTWLDDIDWSTDATREQVQARAATIGLRVALAPDGFDVDRAEDLPRLAADIAADPERAPETAAALAAGDETGLVSVIVAALNENIGLDACLEALRAQPGPLEIVVADGGSSDRSPERAASAGAVVASSPPGRGRQLAAGAALATSDTFLFLHTDTRLPPGGADLVRAAIAAGDEAGAFVTHTVADRNRRNWCGPLLRLADVRSRVTRHPYGDQAMFATRAAYESVGGFHSLPIMEDYDLSVRLAARRPLARIREPVTVSGRRIQSRPMRSMVLMRVIPILFRAGVSPHVLARMYRRW